MEETSIKFIRLITGEDLVADVTEVIDAHGPSYLVLSNPLKIVYMANPNNPSRVAISLMQWIFTKMSDEQEFKVMMKDVITTSHASETLIGYYNDFVNTFDDAMKEFDKSNASRNITDELWRELHETAFDHDPSYANMTDKELDVENLSDGEGLEMLGKLLEDIRNAKKGKLN